MLNITTLAKLDSDLTQMYQRMPVFDDAVYIGA